jgi:hypothetical protein
VFYTPESHLEKKLKLDLYYSRNNNILQNIFIEQVPRILTCFVLVHWFENTVHDLLDYSHPSLRVADSTTDNFNT